jgi:superfamily II DNA or RNA helicase
MDFTNFTFDSSKLWFLPKSNACEGDRLHLSTSKVKVEGQAPALIEIENSFCYLRGFSPSAIDLIRQRLTYEDQDVAYEIRQAKVQLQMAFRYKNHRKVGWLKSRIADLEKRINVCWLDGVRFQTGHLTIVIAELLENRLAFELEDRRKNVANRVEYVWQKEPMPPVRYYQEDMVKLGVAHHRGVFESAVGTGKTYIAQLLVHALKVPTLVVLPSKDLSVQTYDAFCAAFGKNLVELIDTGIGKANTRKPIRICTVHTLTACLKKGVLERLLDGLGMILIDEVHHAGASSYTALLPFFDHIYYRFGFSGTFMRNDSRTLDMWGFLSTVLYRYPASKATKEGYLTPLEVLIHPIEGVRAASYQTEYVKNYCKNPALLERILSIVEGAGKDDQVLILVGRKDQSGKVIHEYLTMMGVENTYISGDSKRDVIKTALSAFNRKEVRVLIGSTIIGEGIDVRSTDHLIMAQGGKSEIAITQAVGRAVRLFEGKVTAFIHDFNFLGTKYLERHLKRRKEIYQRNFDAKVEGSEDV